MVFTVLIMCARREHDGNVAADAALIAVGSFDMVNHDNGGTAGVEDDGSGSGSGSGSGIDVD